MANPRLRDGYVRRNLAALVAAAIGLALLLPTALPAHQIYVGDLNASEIRKFLPEEGDTIGVVVSPDTLQLSLWSLVSMEADGSLLVTAWSGIYKFNPADQSMETLLDSLGYMEAVAAYPDAATDDIYFATDYEDGSPSELRYLPDGHGPSVVAWSFNDGEFQTPYDVQVAPTGEYQGDILWLSCSPHFLARLRRTGEDTFERLDDVYNGEYGGPREFAYSPDGDIYVLDATYGVDKVVNGELVPFGDIAGGYFSDMDIASDGTFYVVDTEANAVRRMDSAGNEILPPLGRSVFLMPYTVVATSFTPTRPGDAVVIAPDEDVDMLFEEVVEGGFTYVVSEGSNSHTSPNGNYLPGFVQPAGGERDDFTYVDLVTESVYGSLVQIDAYYPGSRLFFAHGTGDTFRDATIEGTIEDARGVISRFSEVVVGDDSRPLSTVIAYKFWRLLAELDRPLPSGYDFCPDGAILRLRWFATRAKDLYDLGQAAAARDVLAHMNEVARDLAGWCIPDTVPVNDTGEILALSKTLMFSLDQVEPPASPTAGSGAAEVSLSVTSPARGRSLVEFTGPDGAEVTARVYSVSGKLVTTLFEGELRGGRERVVWDGTAGSGEPVASGVYFVRLEAGEEVLTSKVVLIR